MTYDRIVKRQGRNRSRNKQPLPIEQKDWRGVNYVDDIYTMPPQQLPFAQNVDLGAPIGAISKVAGYESLFTSLGAGKILGLHTWEHSDGDKLIAAWDKYLYLLSGASGSIAKTSQADWAAGTGVNLDLTTSSGDVKLAKTGVDFSHADTTTADFNGTHSNTVAITNSVALGTQPNTYGITSLGGTSVDATGSSFEIGWKFTVGASNIVINKLRIFAPSSGSYTIKLWRVSDQALLSSVVVAATGGAWTEGAIAEITLSASTAYVVSTNMIAQEMRYSLSASCSFYSGITFNNGMWANNNGVYPSIAQGNVVFGIVDICVKITSYYSSGTYTHTVQDVSSAVVAKTATITFNKTTPANTTCTVEVNVSTDGGSTWGGWVAKNSGDTIITAGTTVSNYRVRWRSNLATTDPASTPSLDDVTVSVTTAYYTSGSWISIALDMANTPITAVLSWVQTTPAGTSATWYARGSSNGTVFGDWQEITVSGGSIPLLRYVQIKFLLAGTIAATPIASSLLISYSTSYTQANRLDITPLGRTSNLLTGNRVRMQDYNNMCYCADGLRPFVLYVDATTAVTGTAQAGTTNTIRLAAGASAANDFFNNALVTITGGSGVGQVRFISDYNGTTKDATVSVNWTNLLTNNQASIETDTTGFAAMSGATISRDTTEHWNGTASLKVVCPGSVLYEGVYTTNIVVSPSTVYTGSFWIKATAGKSLTIQLTDGVIETHVSFTASGIWERKEITHTVSASSTALALRCYTETSIQAVTFYLDGLQIEKSNIATDWALSPDATSTYSISSAVKARKAGVDPPGTAPTLADSTVAGTPNGVYYGKITFVNADGYESNPSAASASLTVASKKITWTAPVDASAGNTTASRKLYRTKAGGSVYYYVATISDNTTTAYTDNIADTSLTVLMEDNNNIPPNASIVYMFMEYMFYANGSDLWFSKVGTPEQVPNITGDMQVNTLPSTILDIKSNPMALIPQGENFIAPITTNTGFIFDSDPTVDTTMMRLIDKNGSLSFEASDICIDPQLRSILVFPTNTGVRTLLPGLQDGSIESTPMSRNIQDYFDRTVNRTNMAGVFFNSYYLISVEHHNPDLLVNEYLTFAYDFRTSEWYGPWTFGCSCYIISAGVLYAGDPAVGKVYRMFTGSSSDGANLKMIADLPMVSPGGENRTYKFNKFMLMLSDDSDTSVTIVKPKVDSREATVTLGTLTDTFTGDVRPGHNNLRSKKYKIPLSRGNTLSYRIEDDSTHPISIQKVITECEVLPLKR